MLLKKIYENDSPDHNTHVLKTKARPNVVWEKSDIGRKTKFFFLLL